MERRSLNPTRLTLGFLMALGAGNGCNDCGTGTRRPLPSEGAGVPPGASPEGSGTSGEGLTAEEMAALEDSCIPAKQESGDFPLENHFAEMARVMAAREDIRNAFRKLLDEGDPRRGFLPIPSQLDEVTKTPDVARDLVALIHHLITELCSALSFADSQGSSSAIASTKGYGYDVQILTDIANFDSEAIAEDLIVNGNERSRMTKAQCMEMTRRVYAALLEILRPDLSCRSNFFRFLEGTNHAHYIHSIGCQAPGSEETKPVWRRGNFDGPAFVPDGGSDAASPSGDSRQPRERLFEHPSPQPIPSHRRTPARKKGKRPPPEREPMPWIPYRLVQQPPKHIPYFVRRGTRRAA